MFWLCFCDPYKIFFFFWKAEHYYYRGCIVFTCCKSHSKWSKNKLIQSFWRGSLLPLNVGRWLLCFNSVFLIGFKVSGDLLQFITSRVILIYCFFYYFFLTIFKTFFLLFHSFFYPVFLLFLPFSTSICKSPSVLT